MQNMAFCIPIGSTLFYSDPILYKNSKATTTTLLVLYEKNRKIVLENTVIPRKKLHLQTLQDTRHKHPNFSLVCGFSSVLFSSGFDVGI